MVDYLMTHHAAAKSVFKCKEEDLLTVQEVCHAHPNPNYDKDSAGNMVLHITVWSGQVSAWVRGRAKVRASATPAQTKRSTSRTSVRPTAASRSPRSTAPALRSRRRPRSPGRVSSQSPNEGACEC
jgi:hypothetical protein